MTDINSLARQGDQLAMALAGASNRNRWVETETSGQPAVQEEVVQFYSDDLQGAGNRLPPMTSDQRLMADILRAIG